MLKIRLKRIGKKKQAFYRVVVMDSTSKRDGKTIADLGSYNPHVKDSIKIDTKLAQEWLSKGAQPSETVAQYFVKMKLLDKIVKKSSTKSKGKTKKKAQKTE